MGSGPVIWAPLSPTLTSPSCKEAFPAACFLIWSLTAQAQALVLCLLLPPQLPLSFFLHYEVQRPPPPAWLCSVNFSSGHSTENPFQRFTCLDVVSVAFAHAVGLSPLYAAAPPNAQGASARMPSD